jgi:hypothetical protein
MAGIADGRASCAGNCSPAESLGWRTVTPPSDGLPALPVICLQIDGVVGALVAIPRCTALSGAMLGVTGSGCSVSAVIVTVTNTVLTL